MGLGSSIENGPISANYSDYTQSIVNQFPDWHIARRHRDSTVAKIINAAAGISMENILNVELPNFVSQRILSLANTDTNDKAFTIDVSNQQFKRTVIYNLLKNSVFDIWSNPVRPPDNWTLELEDPDLLPLFDLINLYMEENYQSGSSLTFSSRPSDSTTYGEVKFFQEVDVSQISSTDWSASVWTKRSGSSPITTDMFKFYVEVDKKDSTVPLVYEYAITDTYNWQRHTIKFSTSGIIDSIRVGIKFNPVTVGSIVFMHATSFCLFPTVTSNFWARNGDDKPNFIYTPQTGKTVMLTSPTMEKKLSFVEISGDEISNSLLPNHSAIEFFSTSEELPAPTYNGIFINDGFLIDGTRVGQKVIIGSEGTRAKYGWPLWTVGRLIKFSSYDPSEIYGSYIPSFPVGDGTADAVASIEMQCMTEHGNSLWILGKVKTGSGLNFMNRVGLMLFVISKQLPKIPNDVEEVDISRKLFLPIKHTYYFSSASLDGSYGSDPYGSGLWGGNSPVTNIPHLSMEFINGYQLQTNLQYGYKSIITLNYNYFVDNSSEVILLRDPREDQLGSEVVVW